MPPRKRYTPKPRYDSATARKRGFKRDKAGHLPSRDPKSGKILKREDHPTFGKAITADQKLGYKAYRNVRTGSIHTFKRKPDPKKYKPYRGKRK